MFTNAHANCGTKVSQKSMIPANSDKCHPRNCIDLLLDKITTLIKWVVIRKNCLPTISVSWCVAQRTQKIQFNQSS